MNIIHFETIDSTNTYAKLNIDDLADETVISADSQTAGRGRFTRSWVDLGSENIYMTIIFKPEKLLPSHYNLTQYLSLCLCKLIEEYGIVPQIKWPNDVLLNNKKVCGILAETVFKGEKLKGIVLGIGVNLNASKENLDKIDRPATSLNLELGTNIDKDDFMVRLLNKFFEGYYKFSDLGFESIKTEYVKRASFINQNLKIAVFKDTYEGFCTGVDSDGSLFLKLSDGTIEKYNMGEII